jgi:hypothetical protein
MKRLREETDSQDPKIALAAEAIGAKEPRPRDPFLKERVRKGLQSGGPARRHRFQLRPAAATVMVLVLAAVASAMWARSHFAQKSRVPSTEAIQPVQPPAPTPPAPPPPVAAPPSPTVVPSPPAPIPPAPPKRAPKNVAPPVVAVPSPPAPPVAVPPPAVDPEEETELVTGAYRALHQEKDPDKALRMLDRCARLFPDGVLAEEVLALRIQVLLAKRDSSVGRLGEEYLAKHPGGRWKQVAEEARRLFPAKVLDR